MIDIAGNFIGETHASYTTPPNSNIPIPFTPSVVILIRSAKNLIERLDNNLDYKIELEALKQEIAAFNKD